MTATAIRARSLGVRFVLDRHRRVLTPALARIRRARFEYWGLREVDLDLEPGDRVALLGHSGAGKTTLLRTIAGILAPDAGSIEVVGRVASLLSVEAGLLPALTGRENALLLAVLTGVTRGGSRASLPAVQRASGLGDAFDRSVAGFSQGMRSRLGLAVAEHARPDILLLDEVHEALDEEYREQLGQQVVEACGAGAIVVAAGHDLGMLERLCERGLLLEGGRIAASGSFGEIRDAYLESYASE